MLTDLDKLYIAMAEVGSAHLFNVFCYSLNIKSLKALEDFDSRLGIVVDQLQINIVKKKIRVAITEHLDFKVLANKVILLVIFCRFTVKCNII